MVKGRRATQARTLVIIIIATLAVVGAMFWLLASQSSNDEVILSQAPPGVGASAACPHNGLAAPLPTTSPTCPKGSKSVASLGLDQCSTPGYEFGGCNTQNQWSIDVMPPATTIGTLGSGVGAVTNGVANFIINITKSSSTAVYFEGTATIGLTNGGNCDASLISLLLFLETPATKQLPGNSYGPSGSNFRLLATSGIEAAVTAQCDAQEAPAVIARICETTACNVGVNYDASLIKDQTTNALLDLGAYTVPARTSCTTGARTLAIKFSFAVSSTVLGQLPAGATFRVSSALTFDACCDRGSSCAIDVSCTAPAEIVRTVFSRSAVLSLPSASSCGASDGCREVALRINSGGSSYSAPNGCGYTTEFFVTSTVATQSSVLTIPENIVCDSTACSCDTSLTSAATVTATLSALNADCNNAITGASLINPSTDSASATFTCADPTPIACQWSSWSAWSPIANPTYCSNAAGTGCHLVPQRSRSVAAPQCHGGAACTGATQQGCTSGCTYDAALDQSICGVTFNDNAWSAWSACASPTVQGQCHRSRSHAAKTDACGTTITIPNEIENCNCPCSLIGPTATVSSVTTTSAAITVNVPSINSVCTLYSGLTTSYERAAISTAISTSSVFTLATLTPSTLYYYMISCTAQAGVTCSLPGSTFTTLTPPPPPPVATPSATTPPPPPPTPSAQPQVPPPVTCTNNGLCLPKQGFCTGGYRANGACFSQADCKSHCVLGEDGEQRCVHNGDIFCSADADCVGGNGVCTNATTGAPLSQGFYCSANSAQACNGWSDTTTCRPGCPALGCVQQSCVLNQGTCAGGYNAGLTCTAQSTCNSNLCTQDDTGSFTCSGDPSVFCTTTADCSNGICRTATGSAVNSGFSCSINTAQTCAGFGDFTSCQPLYC